MRTIPEMTDKRGRHWEQPNRGNIILLGNKAFMCRSVWEKLAAYDSSVPSGVYEGKMWRASGADAQGPWQQLRWYGKSTRPDCCSVNVADVVVCDNIWRDDGRVCIISKASSLAPWALCDGWLAGSSITDKTATCLACIADGGNPRPSSLRCSLCSAPVGSCPHTRRKL